MKNNIEKTKSVSLIRKDSYIILACFCLAIVSILGITDWVVDNFLTATITIGILGFLSHLYLFSTHHTIIHPAFLLSVVSVPFFIIIPIIQLYIGEFSIYHIDSIPKNFLIAAIMVFVYVITFTTGLKIFIKSEACKPITEQHDIQLIPHLKIIIYASVSFGTFIWGLFFYNAGGVLFFLDNVANKTKLLASVPSGGYLIMLGSFLQVGTMMAVLFSKKNNRIIPLPIMMLMICLSITPNLIMGMRSRLVMYIVILVLLSADLTKRINLKRWFLFCLLFVGVIFFWGQVRSFGVGTGLMTDSNLLADSFKWQSEHSLKKVFIDYGFFERLSLIHEYVPDRVPFQYGKTVISFIFLPIPRSFYENKPMGSGPLLANAFRPGSWDLSRGMTSGVTPTLIGELYLNFWWFGIAIGGFIIGSISGKLYNRWIVQYPTQWNKLKYVIFAVYFLAQGLLGEFYGTMSVFLIYLIIANIMQFFTQISIGKKIENFIVVNLSNRKG